MNAVEFDRVSKSYPIYESPGDRLREFLLFRGRSRHRAFSALRDLSFSIAPGEVFCIVGENGSGKSTALQLMAGIMQPTAGEVRVNGRVAALLELGAGFNTEFTGRENVYLNASILGLTKRDTARRFGAIEEFAEIGDFIDRPVKTYSSGMALRLAFAVAINVDPEILIVDEALAVGDAYFRHRCMRRVHELRALGVTIVFVSHSMSDVKAIGDRALWLRHGEAVELNDVETVIRRYLAAMTESPAPRAASIAPVHDVPNIDARRGDGGAEIRGFAVMNEFGEPLQLMTANTTITARMTFRARRRLDRADAGFVIRNHLGIDFAEIGASVESRRLAAIRPGETVTIEFPVDIPELYPGSFSFSPWVKDGGTICDAIDNAVTAQMARGEGPVYGYFQQPCRMALDERADPPQAARVD